MGSRVTRQRDSELCDSGVGKNTLRALLVFSVYGWVFSVQHLKSFFQCKALSLVVDCTLCYYYTCFLDPSPALYFFSLDTEVFNSL